MNLKNLKQNWRRALSLSLVAVMTLSLAACKKKTETKEELPEFTYVPQHIELDGNQGYWRAIIKGNYLYNMVSDWDEITQTSSQKIMKYPIEEDKLGEGISVIEFNGNTNIQSFTFDQDENFYLIEIKYPELAEGEEPGEDYWSKRQTFLSKYDAQSQPVYQQDISDMLAEDDNFGYIDTMVLDDEGRIYATSGERIRLFDKDGKGEGIVDGDSHYFSGIGQGKDGKVYVSYYDSTADGGGYVLAQVDYNGKKLGEVYKNFIGGNNSILTPGIEKDFLVQDGTNVYEYDLATQTSENLFNLVECEINENYVEQIGVREEGRLMVMTNDWNTGGYEMALLTKKKTSEVPVKEILTVGSLYDDYRLNQSVVAFNKSSDKYRIRIKTYVDYNNWSEESLKDAITNLNNDIISGTNCPDILNLSSLNMRQLTAKNVLEDLTPYLENSSKINRADYLENVLESLTIDGTLVTIPYSFSLRTVMGKTSEVGDKMGWTLEEMIAFCEEHPGSMLFNYADKSSILSYCLNYNEAAFINWETGECKFDSPEFKQLLEFVNKFPDEFDWEADNRSTPEKLASGDVLLNRSYINSYEDFQYEIAQFNGETVTCIGFPDVSGGSGCQMNVQETYGISARSEYKDAAWAFIESVLTKESDYRFGDNFSTRRSELAKQREEATKVTYVTDENGEPVLDEDGNPIEEGGSSSGSITIYGNDGGGWSYSYHRTTEEEADMVDALIAVAVPISMDDDSSQIINIITEEADGYFKGQKSVDDVAGIIQSRLQLYVNENR